jgi:hypothetical protein
MCSFYVFSPILMIILKSEHSWCQPFAFILNNHRILMTCLKYLAQCPCPRCLILKSNIPRLGMEVDKKARQKLTRVDSKEIQNKVNHARRLMFEDGINISSVFIDRLLRPHSLVPTRVSSFMSLISNPDLSISECVFSSTP